MTTTPRFRGTGTAIVTPFRKDGSLDEQALRKLVEFQVAGGVEAIVPVGTTGENPTLTQEEQFRVVDIVVDATRRRAKVFAGAGSNSTAKAVELARHAKSAGADAALVVGPYYNKPTQEGYFQHFRSIAEASGIPVIVYNVPGRTGGNIEAATVLRMAEEIPFVSGVKEASGNLNQIMEIARNRPARFSLLSGDDAFTLPLMSLGGDGCISVVANETPAEFSRMVRCCIEGKWDDALKLHNKLLPLMNANFIEANPIPVKTAVAMMGMIEETFRLPMVPIGSKNREILRSILKDQKLV